jgi:hypothetical protein
MTHEDKGNYAGKHPDGTKDPVIVAKLEKFREQNRITCSAAHRAAAELNVLPAEIGIQLDLMELRLVKCQLGLFGHESESRPMDNDFQVSDELKERLKNAAVNGRISCKDCWDIAGEFKISRPDMGAACETLNLRIKPCQLGAF